MASNVRPDDEMVMKAMDVSGMDDTYYRVCVNGRVLNVPVSGARRAAMGKHYAMTAPRYYLEALQHAGAPVTGQEVPPPS